eukprot:scaffold16089_cov54-Phaeocystis_antarctica.AAC.2
MDSALRHLAQRVWWASSACAPCSLGRAASAWAAWPQGHRGRLAAWPSGPPARRETHTASRGILPRPSSRGVVSLEALRRESRLACPCLRDARGGMRRYAVVV